MLKLRVSLSFGLTLSILAALIAVPGHSQILRASGRGGLSALAFSHEKLRSAEHVVPLERAASAKSIQDGWEAFRLGAGPEAKWQASVDERTGLISFAEGGNLPWIPGHGNRMTLQDLAGDRKRKIDRVDLDVLDSVARSFLPRVTEMIGVDPAELALSRGRSGQPAGYLWFVDYDVVRDGLPVEGARVLFRVNNGNLIQFGSENLPSPGAIVPPTRLTKRQARAAVAAYLGGFQKGGTFQDDGSLHLIPVGTADGGRGLAKVWQIVLRREGETPTWRARVDATTGEVVELIDVNQYAETNGGVYLESPSTTLEVTRPMPYIDLSTGGYANSAGVFPYTFGTVTTALNGLYVKAGDYQCGPITRSAEANGNILFGTSSGTDCAVPAGAAAGDTHAARTAYYNLNRIKEMVRGWMPGNTWNNQQQEVFVNNSNVCGPYSSAGIISLQQSFSQTGLSSCTNSGENAGLLFHEFGHTLDENDGNGLTGDGTTSQTYADTMAMIALHDSCIGRGFWYVDCTTFGVDACLNCKGLRDADYAQHVSHGAATAANFIWQCPDPYMGEFPGLCGKDLDCEANVPDQALWDVANRDLPSPGTAAAWAIFDRLWFLSRSTATAAFSCSPGAIYGSDGCGAGSLWKVFRAADDDDGNLSNGTPHGRALYAAFNRHLIACTSDAGANTTFAGCAAPSAPASLTAVAGDDQVNLSWGSSGSNVYDVFRNEVGCNSGFTRIATGLTSPSLKDSAVADGTTYYYQVTAYPTGNEACASVPSTCISVAPAAAACTAPAAPASLTATAPASGGVALSWTAVTGASVYYVYRGTASGGPYTQIGSAAVTMFTDLSTSGGSTYFYVVRAVHVSNDGASCNSGNSPQATATPVPDFALSITPAAGTVPSGGTSITYTLTVTRLGGFTGAVSLTYSFSPSTGISATLSPNPVTGTSATLHVTVPAFGGLSSHLTVTGVSGALTHTATATLSR
jgi:hypothetical protein